MATTSEADAREVMRRYFNGVNNEDWEDFAGIWHDDAVVDVSGGLHFEGVDQILPYYPSVLKNFPRHHDDPWGIHVAGDIVTVEITFAGETLDGVEAGWEAVDVFTLRDGKIAKLTTWYDMGLVVGLLRQPGKPEKRLASLVRLAAAKSPFYKARLAGLGLDAAAVAADLTALPPTTPADLDGALGDFAVAGEGELRQVGVTSGGSIFSLTRGDMEDAAWCLSRALEWAGAGRGSVIAATEPVPALADAALRLKARFAPTAAAAAVATVTVGPGGTVVPGESYLETPETGVFAARCPQGSLHALADAHIVEVADGAILVTPLGRKGLPLLRYATGHRGAWVEGACGCGSELPRLALEA